MSMFDLSAEALRPDALKRSLERRAAGACVTFEGWVRDHNEGRRVLRLEYEAYPELCRTEGGRIVAEAVRRHGLLAAHCVHRTGALEIGDAAVWVGAVSPHRAEAFAACRYIIDAIKCSVPIWKKEHYEDGDSGWVNCERCAGTEHGAHDGACGHAREHGGAPDAAEVTPSAYYARQMRLPEVGSAGQERLARARALVVGAGGLGCPALQYLAGAGVGGIGICDADAVDLSNLHRQPLFRPEQIGMNKAEAAAGFVRALNPMIDVRAYPVRLEAGNAAVLFRDHDIVLDCTDNLETKFLLNDAAVREGKTLIQASIHQYEGQLFAYAPGGKAPCLRCLWRVMPAPDCVGSCAEAGVLGAVPGVFGALQAAEALKHLLQLPDRLEGRMVFFDLLGFRASSVRIRQDMACPSCGAGTPADRGEEAPVGIAADGPEDPRIAGMAVIDLREPAEAAAAPVAWPGMRHIPLSAFPLDPPPIDADTPCLLCCGRGVRSRMLALRLREQGCARVYSLEGGLQALSAAIR